MVAFLVHQAVYGHFRQVVRAVHPGAVGFAVVQAGIGQSPTRQAYPNAVAMGRNHAYTGDDMSQARVFNLQLSFQVLPILVLLVN